MSAIEAAAKALKPSSRYPHMPNQMSCEKDAEERKQSCLSSTMPHTTAGMIDSKHLTSHSLGLQRCRSRRDAELKALEPGTNKIMEFYVKVSMLSKKKNKKNLALLYISAAIQHQSPVCVCSLLKFQVFSGFRQ